MNWSAQPTYLGGGSNIRDTLRLFEALHSRTMQIVQILLSSLLACPFGGAILLGVSLYVDIIIFLLASNCKFGSLNKAWAEYQLRQDRYNFPGIVRSDCLPREDENET